jgi:hypothetical protein
MFNLMPKVKEIVALEGNTSLSHIKTLYCDPLFGEIGDEVKKILPDITPLAASDDADMVITLEAFAKEEYKIEVQNDKIMIQAGFKPGCFYALKTLSQIIGQSYGTLPNMHIHDFPSLSIRGFMADISRNKVPKLETLKMLADKMADLKYNHLELYVEGFSFEYRSFKEYLEAESYITVAEYQELERYCKARMIDLVPNMNGFGHMMDWLRLDEFKHLAECPDGFFIWGAHRAPSTLNATDDGSVKLVKQMYDDMLPYSTSPYFNMNFDEPYELGEGKSKAYCQEQGKENVFVEYLKKLYCHVKNYDKTGLIWGDFLIRHPEAIRKLPEDIIFIDWGYNKTYPFDQHLKMLGDLNINFMAAPGTSSWMSVMGKADDMMETVRNSTTHTKLNHGQGVLLTDWGDLGHIQYLPVSYFGLAYAGGAMWSEDVPNEEDVCHYLNHSIFKDPTEILGKLMPEMGRYDRLEGLVSDYGTKTFMSVLWAEHMIKETDPLAAFMNKMKTNIIDETHLEKLWTASLEWEKKLNDSRPAVEDSDLIRKE